MGSAFLRQKTINDIIIDTYNVHSEIKCIGFSDFQQSNSNNPESIELRISILIENCFRMNIEKRLGRML
ncbi:cytochrome P450 9e2-like [Vespula maculifrons]|uniref:Cytochrome P450 9e2-like n=1 Tax=Vespula maculifrons TaxID=7453 RepID=A0ABD2B622_VESMC